MKPGKEPLFTPQQIAAQVTDLAALLDRHYADGTVVALIVLKGALHFGSDLLRCMQIPVTVDFVRAHSYTGTESSGVVEFLVHPTIPLKDKHILIIEDILDTGTTANAILAWVRSQNPASVQFCALFDKPSRRTVTLEADYVGFTIDDHFLVGYGMDYKERYRELPGVHILG